MAEPRAIDPKIRTGYNASGSVISKGYIVKVAGTTYQDQIALAAAATDALFGVAANDIATGGPGNVQVSGRALVYAGGTVAVGARVTTDSAGKGVAASAGNSVLGVAMTAGASGSLFEVELGLGGNEMAG
jgi:hypothetical protein